MNWPDERYVRWYTRDTVDWLALSFEAQGLLGLIFRKVDRAGILRLGKHGSRGVAAAIGHAHRWETIAPALGELVDDGCVVLAGDHLVVRNFIEAQEAKTNDAQRKRDQRERDRAKALADGAPPPTSHAGLDSIAEQGRRSQHAVTPDVTQDGHAQESHQEVTLSLAVPSRTEPAKEATACAEQISAPLAKEPLVLIPQDAPSQPTDFVAFALATWPHLERAALEELEAAARAAYPGVDVLGETKKLRAWEVANPRQAHTNKTRALNAWFQKAQSDVADRAMRKTAPERPGARVAAHSVSDRPVGRQFLKPPGGAK